MLELLAEIERNREESVTRQEFLETLSDKVDKLATWVGGLSDNFGYGLEDMTYGLLKKSLKRDFNLSG